MQHDEHIVVNRRRGPRVFVERREEKQQKEGLPEFPGHFVSGTDMLTPQCDG